MKSLSLSVLLAAFLLSLSWSCTPSSCPNRSNVLRGIIEWEEEFPGCLQLDGSEFIIQSDSGLRAMQDASLTPNCQTIELPEIDFQQFTLLGKTVNSSGCDFYYVKKVSEDKSEEKYVFEISPRSCGECDILAVSTQWVVVPILPENYTVEFIVND